LDRTRTPRDVADATTVTPATGVAGTERPYNGTAEVGRVHILPRSLTKEENALLFE
jgi:hypothetical protein